MENLNNKFTGVFISAESLADNNTTLQEKMILAMISGLDNENGCTAKNDYFANILNMTTRRVREIITSLEKKGYIKREDVQTGRKLFVVKSKVVTEQPKQEPVKKVPTTPKKVATSKKVSKFTNIVSHDRDFDKLEQLEQAHVRVQLGSISQEEYNQIKSACGFGVTIEPSECVGGQEQFKIEIPTFKAPVGIDEKTLNLLNAGYSMEEIELFRSKLN